MRYPSRNSPHWKAAVRAVANHLADATKPVLFFDISCTADQGARLAGRKTDLSESLFDYTVLLPDNWTTAWVGGSSPFGDRLYYAIPRGWESGQVGPSLTATLMGPGPLAVVSSPDS